MEVIIVIANSIRRAGGRAQAEGPPHTQTRSHRIARALRRQGVHEGVGIAPPLLLQWLLDQSIGFMHATAPREEGASRLFDRRLSNKLFRARHARREVI